MKGPAAAVAWLEARNPRKIRYKIEHLPPVTADDEEK
jgi:hypothetical protein